MRRWKSSGTGGHITEATVIWFHKNKCATRSWVSWRWHRASRCRRQMLIKFPIDKSYVVVERALQWLHVCYGLSKSWKHVRGKNFIGFQTHHLPDKPVADMYMNLWCQSLTKNSSLSRHFWFCDFPCWYVTWAQIVKLHSGISSRRQKVPGPKDKIISGFAIPLFDPCKCWLPVHFGPEILWAVPMH